MNSSLTFKIHNNLSLSPLLSNLILSPLLNIDIHSPNSDYTVKTEKISFQSYEYKITARKIQWAENFSLFIAI